MKLDSTGFQAKSTDYRVESKTWTKILAAECLAHVVCLGDPLLAAHVSLDDSSFRYSEEVGGCSRS